MNCSVFDTTLIIILAISPPAPNLFMTLHFLRLSQAAMAKFDEVKEQSATGLQHSIEQHKYTEISVDLMSSYVLVPEGGLMKK